MSVGCNGLTDAQYNRLQAVMLVRDALRTARSVFQRVEKLSVENGRLDVRAAFASNGDSVALVVGESSIHVALAVGATQLEVRIAAVRPAVERIIYEPRIRNLTLATVPDQALHADQFFNSVATRLF